MDRRFRVMAAIGVRNISGYNKKVLAASAAGEPLTDPLTEDDDENRPAASGIALYRGHRR